MVRQIKRMAGLCVAFAAFALLASPAAAQREITDAPEIWVHKATGAAFPSRLGNSPRSGVTEFTEDGRDAGVAYNLVRDGRTVGVVTIYVYPPFPIGGCAAQYADVKKSIEQSTSYRNVRLISESRAPSPGGSDADGAYFATYAYDVVFKDGAQQSARSDAYLYCPTGEKWLVAYRATWNADVDMSAEAKTLFRSIHWPEILDK